MTLDSQLKAFIYNLTWLVKHRALMSSYTVLFAALEHTHINKVAATMPKKNTDNIVTPCLDETREAMNENSSLSTVIDPKYGTIYK